MYRNKIRKSVYTDESCNATESSSVASSLEESDSDATSVERWIASSSSRTKHSSLLQKESSKIQNVSVTASENTSNPCKSIDSYPSGNVIRSRLLNKLGFEPAVSSRPKVPTVTPQPSLHENNAFLVDLKGDYGAPAKIRSCTTQDRSINNAKRRILFHPEVTVQLIPSHTDFSDRIRRVMWTDAVEMDENVARNCLEYTAEGWDWRNVVSDEDMIVINGEKIHPVHFGQDGHNHLLCGVLPSHLQ